MLFAQSPKAFSDRQKTLVCFGLVAILSLSTYLGHKAAICWDMAWYMVRGLNMLMGHGYVGEDRGAVFFERAPFFPAMLAAALWFRQNTGSRVLDRANLCPDHTDTALFSGNADIRSDGGCRCRRGLHMTRSESTSHPCAISMRYGRPLFFGPYRHHDGTAKTQFLPRRVVRYLHRYRIPGEGIVHRIFHRSPLGMVSPAGIPESRNGLKLALTATGGVSVLHYSLVDLCVRPHEHAEYDRRPGIQWLPVSMIGERGRNSRGRAGRKFRAPRGVRG